MNMRKIAAVLSSAALALPVAAWADIYAYVGLPLTATQETSTTSSAGYGSVTAIYDSATKALVYSIVYQLDPAATATAAHFHGPAALGANAGVAIGLPTQPTGNAGKLTGTVTLTPAQETDLLAGLWYFNIHSTIAGGGELRAQLLENSASLVVPTFANGKLNIPVVLVPGAAGAASYSADLTYSGSSNSFELTGASPLR